MTKNNTAIIPFLLPWDWSADYQRQTALELSKNHLVICYMHQENSFFLKKNNNTAKYPELKNIIFHIPKHKIPFKRFQYIDHLNITQQILNLAKQNNPSLIWIFDPFFHFLTKQNKVTTLYDCVDYHSGSSAPPQQQWESQLIQNANFYTVNSHILAKLHSKIRKPDAIVPQGFRIEDFKKPPYTIHKFPKNKPLIGYVGAINSRMNLDILIPLIKNNPQWNFVIWGPKQIFKTDSHQQIIKINKLLNLPNIIHGCSYNKKEVPSIIKQFNVAIIPYDIKQPFNKYCYPMKLFEYFYMGKPVISTPIEELKQFSEFVKIGNTAQEWAIHIKFLLSKPWSEKNKIEQKKLAIENSWEKKIAKINNILIPKY